MNYELEYDFLEASKTGNIGERIFHYLRVRNMLKMIEGSNLNILDVGCGTGILFEHICKNNNVTGVDISKWCIEMAKQHADNIGVKPKLYVGDAFKLKFEHNQFDLIVLSGVLEHLRGDVQIVIRKVHKLLKKNGKALVSLPCHAPFNPLSYIVVYDFLRKAFSRRKDIDEEGFHKHFTVKELKGIFKGFSLLKSSKTALGTELCVLFQKI